MKSPENNNRLGNLVATGAAIIAAGILITDARGAAVNQQSIVNPAECLRYLPTGAEQRACYALTGKIATSMTLEYRYGKSPTDSLMETVNAGFNYNVKGPLAAQTKKEISNPKWPRGNNEVRNKLKIIEIDIEENGNRAVIEADVDLLVKSKIGKTLLEKRGTRFLEMCRVKGFLGLVDRWVAVKQSVKRADANLGCTAFAAAEENGTATF